MHRVDILVESRLEWSTRTKQLAAIFDLEKKASSESWCFDVQLPPQWQIGLIVGASGSGKSTVARELFGDSFVSFDWATDQTIVDAFPPSASVKQIAQTLSSVGFSSPPSWLRPYHVLSMGQQFRANLARALMADQDLVVIDEFTSVVDRTVAQIGSAAVSKAIRRGSKQFVAVSCHNDIIEWLQPDWILHMPEGHLEARCLRRFPEIHLEVRPAPRSSWKIFSRHHYLDHSVAKSARCFVATWRGRPVAFCAVMFFPHPRRSGWRGHRTVTLPDFQGVGIGNHVSALVASAYKATGKPYRSVTAHPAMIRHRAQSKIWKMIRRPGRVVDIGRTSTIKAMKKSSSRTRYTASFEYVGPENKEAARAWGLI